MPALSKTRIKAYSFLLLNAALWGFGAPIIKYSLDFTTPALFLFYRFIAASFIFFPIFLIHIQRLKKKMSLKHLLLLGLLGGPLTLIPFYYGISTTSSIEASLLESVSPIFTILGGVLLLKEVLKKKEILGVSLAIIGTLFLALEPMLSGNGFSALSVKGNLLIIISDIIWATFLLSSKKDHVDPISLSFVSFVISIPFFFAMVRLEGSALQIHPQAIPGILYMAVGGSILAFWAYQEGQRLIEASEAAIFTYLKPAFAIPLALLWLREPISLITTVAASIIIFGVYLSEKR